MKYKILFISIICFFLCGCGNYNELNKLSIVTGVGFDKDGDNYKLSFLIANSPKAQTSSKEGEAQTTVYTGTGKSISEAAKDIDKKSPKKLYFGHINVVIISESISKDGFLEIADWLIRNPQTRKKFYLLQAKDTSSLNVLKIISPLESFPAQGIATLIESNQESKSIATSITYSNFIGDLLKEGIDAVLPSITVEGDAEEGSKQENLETTEPETYLKLGPLAIFNGDKLKGFTTDIQSQSINILKNESKEINYIVNYDNNDLTIDSSEVKAKITLKDTSHIEINVSGTGNIYNINSNTDISNYKEIKKIEETWNKSLKQDLQEVINIMKYEYQSDIFGFGNLIYQNHPKVWEKIKDEWNEKYFQNLHIKINVNMTISEAGSLNHTIKEEA